MYNLVMLRICARACVPIPECPWQCPLSLLLHINDWKMFTHTHRRVFIFYICISARCPYLTCLQYIKLSIPARVNWHWNWTGASPGLWAYGILAQWPGTWHSDGHYYVPDLTTIQRLSATQHCVCVTIVKVGLPILRTVYSVWELRLPCSLALRANLSESLNHCEQTIDFERDTFTLQVRYTVQYRL